MQLLLAHKILIGAAALLGLGFGIRQLVLFARGEGVGQLAIGLASLATAACLALYLQRLRKKGEPSP